MIRLSCRDLEACSRAVRALYADANLETFPQRALQILAELVPVEHVTYNHYSDHPRLLVARSLPDRPELQPLVPQLEADFHTHPLAAQVFNPSPRTISDVTTFRQFRETAVFRDYYRLVNVTDQMIFSLEEGTSRRIAFALNRHRRSFSARDKAVVSFLSPHLSQAYHNARAKAELVAGIGEIGKGLESIDRAAIFATQAGRIQWLSALAREWLEELFPDWVQSPACLPGAFQNRITLAKKQGSGPSGNSVFELRLEINPEQQVNARFLAAPNGKFLIMLDRERRAIGPALAQSLGLTRREGEVLYWISEAKADREIATILGISPRTVHKHLEHLFGKLGVDNRAAAQRLGWDLRRI